MFGPFTMILAHLFFTLPYVILSVVPKLKDIDKNLIDAALDLGIKPYKAIARIIVPAVAPAIFSGALLAFTVSVDDFVISYYTTGNGFDNLSIWIYSSIGRRSLTPSVYAFSTTLLFVTLGLIILSQVVSYKGKKK
jgi:spermidine/putrescine transport system permease protein